ncbi:MAG: chain-length determining protein [Prevotella sp.]|nr:chain-length determining protein [Candidatus Equicola faecalis]
MEERSKDLETINLRQIIKKLWSKRKQFLIILPTVIILSSLYIICIPRTYTCEIKLAPEYDLANASNLTSLTSQLGFDIGNAPTTDAISPELYPDLIESTSFLVSLFPIQVTSLDKKISTDYYTYLNKHQKSPFWGKTVNAIKDLFSENKKESVTKNVDPFRLTKKQTDIVQKMKKSIKCSVDKKTSVITFTITDQDPLISASIADSVSKKLQDFITEYRTSKARNDVNYYKQLTAKAKQEYVKARQLSGEYGDTHTDVVLKSFQLKQEDLENDQQLKYNNYSTMQTQLQMAMNKVQERTPAFTVLQSATVPVKATGPKRMFFVIGMTMLAFIIASLYFVRKELHFNF